MGSDRPSGRSTTHKHTVPPENTFFFVSLSLGCPIQYCLSPLLEHILAPSLLHMPCSSSPPSLCVGSRLYRGISSGSTANCQPIKGIRLDHSAFSAAFQEYYATRWEDESAHGPWFVSPFLCVFEVAVCPSCIWMIAFRLSILTVLAAVCTVCWVSGCLF